MPVMLVTPEFMVSGVPCGGSFEMAANRRHPALESGLVLALKIQWALHLCGPSLPHLLNGVIATIYLYFKPWESTLWAMHSKQDQKV